MSITQYLYFVLFCSTLVFSPGPMTMLLMSIGMKHGLRKSLPAQFGASSAYFLSLAIFAIGLTTILETHPIIMKIIKYVGVSYLLFLAWKQWRSAKSRAINYSTPKSKKSLKPIHLYYQGLVVGLSNPTAIGLFSIVIPII